MCSRERCGGNVKCLAEVEKIKNNKYAKVTIDC